MYILYCFIYRLMESLHQAQGDISSMMSTVDSLDNLLSTHQYVITLIWLFPNISILFFSTFVNIIHCFLAEHKLYYLICIAGILEDLQQIQRPWMCFNIYFKSFQLEMLHLFWYLDVRFEFIGSIRLNFLLLIKHIQCLLIANAKVVPTLQNTVIYEVCEMATFKLFSSIRRKVN